MAPVRNKNGTPSDDDDKLVYDGKDDKPKRKRQSQSECSAFSQEKPLSYLHPTPQVVTLVGHARFDALETIQMIKPLAASIVSLLVFHARTITNQRSVVLPIYTYADFKKLQLKLSVMLPLFTTIMVKWASTTTAMASYPQCHLIVPWVICLFSVIPIHMPICAVAHLRSQTSPPRSPPVLPRIFPTLL